MASTFAARFKGLVLPVTRSAGGYFAVRTTREVIKSSIRLILATRPGERVMLPEFGSKLDLAVFDPMDSALRSAARTYITDALQKWERRITVVDVQVNPSPDTHVFSITITYVVNEDSQLDSLTLVGIGR